MIRALFLLVTTVLLSSSVAHAQTTNRYICVEIRTNFNDSPGGDWWSNNANRLGRGISTRVVTSAGTTPHTMGGNGCKWVPIPDADTSFTVHVDSMAKRNGIDIIAVSEDILVTKTGVYPSRQMEVRSFSVPNPPPQFPMKLEINAHPTFENLAIGIWAMHRNTFGLGSHSARGCCYDDGAGSLTDDGRCSGSNTDDYDDWPSGSDVAIEFRVKFHESDCCASKYVSVLGGPERVGVSMPSGTRSQWASAHELGHVIVMERMGKRTSTDQSAALYLAPPYAFMDLETEQCMGNWLPWTLDAEFDQNDPLEEGDLFSELTYPAGRSDYPGAGDNGNGLKGPLTMEYQSTAAREGWADFFAAWLFNQRTQSDCVLNDLTVHDFDLDGDIDDNYNNSEGWEFREEQDGLMNCEGGGPGNGEPFPLDDTLKSYVTARDWLGDMTTEGVCVAPAGLSNRAVQYDWLRFWWDMTTDEGIPPHDLADIYVDMCPTNWNTTSTGPNDGRVRRRLEVSAAFHGYTSEYLNQRNNGVDR